MTYSCIRSKVISFSVSRRFTTSSSRHTRRCTNGFVRPSVTACSPCLLYRHFQQFQSPVTRADPSSTSHGCCLSLQVRGFPTSEGVFCIRFRGYIAEGIVSILGVALMQIVHLLSVTMEIMYMSTRDWRTLSLSQNIYPIYRAMTDKEEQGQSHIHWCST